MRVLNVIPSVSPLRGGPSFAIWSLMKGVQANGQTVELITTDDDGLENRLETILVEPVFKDNIAVRYFPRQTRFYTISLPLYFWIRENAKEYDLIHIHGLFSFAPIAAAFVAKKQQIPYIIRPLGTLNRWGRSNGRPRLKAQSIRFVEGPLLEGAAGVHFTSDQEQEEAKDLGLNLNGFVMPLGFDLEKILEEGPTLSVTNKYSRLQGKTNLLFLSRIDPKKGLELLFDSIGEILREDDQLNLIIAGEGEERYVYSLKAMAERLGIKDKIIWTGFISGSEKLAILRTADIFILPSYSENFGIVVVEAMIAGLPVILTDGVATHSFVQHAKAGIVVPKGDGSSLKTALKTLIDQPGRREEMGRRGRAIALEEFSHLKTGRQMSEIYQKLIEASL